MTDLQDAVKDLEICRLCLNLTVAKIHIFTDDFAKMIQMLTSLKVKQNDSLPQVSCLKCARDVKAAFLLRRRIIQSHRAFTNKISRLSSSLASRLNAGETHYGASTTSDFNRLSSSEEGVSTSDIETPIQQLQRIITASPNAEENSVVPDNDAASIAMSEVESNEAPSDEGQGNESASIEQQSVNNVDIKVENSHFDHALSSEKCERIQNLKLAINTKYSNILNSCKQKMYAWKLMNKKDQVNIIKWLDKKNSTTNDTGCKNKLAPPAQRKKREPMKMYCNTCQIKFTNKITYKNHVARHKHKACPVCDKQIRTVYLKKHMTLHEDAPAMCEVCGITCKNPVSLKMHFFYYHKSNLSVCEDCGRSFKTKTKLLYHQRKDHTKERNFKCETCGKSFFAKIYLTKHINMKHMKMRPHICEYCGKGFSGKHALRTHIRQHTNEAPFQCNFCGERFRQRVSLRGHLKSRHKVQEENKVFCDTCGKGFATDVALEVHSRLHSEIKCPWCSDTFAERTYLEQHISQMHPDV